MPHELVEPVDSRPELDEKDRQIAALRSILARCVDEETGLYELALSAYEADGGSDEEARFADTADALITEARALLGEQR